MNSDWNIIFRLGFYGILLMASWMLTIMLTTAALR